MKPTFKQIAEDWLAKYFTAGGGSYSRGLFDGARSLAAHLDARYEVAEKPTPEPECACGEPSPARIVDHGPDKCYLQGTRPKPPEIPDIAELDVPRYNRGGVVFSAYGDEQVYGKINELARAVNRINLLTK